MKKIIASSIGLIMTMVLLAGVNSNLNMQQSVSGDVSQYTHGQPWG